MEAGPAPRAAGPRCRREGGQRGCVGWSRSQEAVGRPTSNRPRRPRAEAGAKGTGIGRGSLRKDAKAGKSLQVCGLETRRGKLAETLTDAVSLASRAGHTSKNRVDGQHRRLVHERGRALGFLASIRRPVIPTPPPSRAGPPGPAYQSSASPSCDCLVLPIPASGCLHRLWRAGDTELEKIVAWRVGDTGLKS